MHGLYDSRNAEYLICAVMFGIRIGFRENTTSNDPTKLYFTVETTVSIVNV